MSSVKELLEQRFSIMPLDKQSQCFDEKQTSFWSECSAETVSKGVIIPFSLQHCFFSAYFAPRGSQYVLKD